MIETPLIVYIMKGFITIETPTVISSEAHNEVDDLELGFAMVAMNFLGSNPIQGETCDDDEEILMRC